MIPLVDETLKDQEYHRSGRSGQKPFELQYAAVCELIPRNPAKSYWLSMSP